MATRNPLITPLKSWMKAASTEEQIALARMVNTSRATLYQYANGHRTASVERAVSIERATESMNKTTGGRLPVVHRTDLTPVCRRCEFARRCLGEAVAVRGDFEPVRAADLKAA